MEMYSHAEKMIFDKIAPEYERRGFEFVDPLSVKMPGDVAHYVPDFLAVKGNKFVAFEVKLRRTYAIDKRLKKLKSDIEKCENWEFNFLFAEEELRDMVSPQTRKDDIVSSLDETEEILQSRGGKRAAFLLAWAAFEASVRLKHGNIFYKPQALGRIITVLAERGEISPDEAGKLRGLAQRRNALVHGDLGTDGLSSMDVEFIKDIVSRLIS